MPRLDSNPTDAAAISIDFDGVEIPAIHGESIAAALTAAGHLKLREDRHGSGRGMLCGMGACFECRVSVNDGPAQRACLTPVAPGMRVKSLRYHEHLTSVESAQQTAHQDEVACETVVVGAGAAGMTVATQLAHAGQQVVVLDERDSAGGQYFKQRIASLQCVRETDRQFEEGARRIDHFQRSGARFIGGTTVWGGFHRADRKIEICATRRHEGRVSSVRVIAGRLVVATGAYEDVPPFSGWTLPGVITTGGAQGLMRAYRVAPGQRVLIAGNGPLNLQLAVELARSGVCVVGVAEAAPAVIPGRARFALGSLLASPSLVLRGAGFLHRLRRFAVPVFNRHIICRAVGKDQVQRATISRISHSGELIKDTEKTFDVDALCIGYRLRPATELLRILGCQFLRDGHGIHIPQRSQMGRTSIRNVYALGDGAAIGGAQLALAEAKLAACDILNRPAAQNDLRELRRQRRFQRNLWAMFDAPSFQLWSDDTIICRCESVTAGTIEQLVDSGTTDINAVKRLCRAGMGICQGRYCKQALEKILTHSPASTDTDLRTRLPVKPVIIKNIAIEKPEWQGYREVAERPASPAGKSDLSCIHHTEVLVIGGGIVGIAAAMTLSRRGVEVALVDRGAVNGEASGGNAGSLHLQLLPFDFDATTSAVSPAARTLALQKLGIQMWLDLDKQFDADLEIEISGGLMLAQSEDDLDHLRQKATLERKLGVDTIILNGQETAQRFPEVAPGVYGAAFCGEEGKINPLLASTPLLADARKRGTEVFEQTAVFSIQHEHGRYRVLTRRGEFRCRRIVIAAGAWTADVGKMLGVDIPVRCAPQQMLVTQAVENRIPFLLSLARRHLTMKQTANGNVLIGGGWPAGREGTSEQSVVLRESLEGNLWAAQCAVPAIRNAEIIRSWAAMGVMIDGAPIVATLPGQPNVGIAVGANGFTMGPAMGRIIADLVLGDDPGIDLAAFSLERFS